MRTFLSRRGLALAGLLLTTGALVAAHAATDTSQEHAVRASAIVTPQDDKVGG
ncbi:MULTISPECIES: hypothetical protein [unclassified Streptomyces]|uniref:hypothetical protein n=1 Tax=unclassified Streptomyces TaxID=2593676 RepID=UPI00364C10F0